MLTEQQLAQIAAEFHRENREPVSVLKPVVREAVDSTHAWLLTQYASFLGGLNGSLPEAASAGLTEGQKRWLLSRVFNRLFYGE